jgi:gamma-glutamyltranspeptidase/glutathione hydrolase
MKNWRMLTSTTGQRIRVPTVFADRSSVGNRQRAAIRRAAGRSRAGSADFDYCCCMPMQSLPRVLPFTGSVLAVCLAVAGCRSATPTAPAVGSAPEAEPAIIEAKPANNWRAGAMVAAANPLAVEAGLEILRRGGSAVDAAVTIQAVLGLVEPQSSGIGGGAFLLHYDADNGDVIAYDGREVAPAGAGPDMFLGADGKPLGYFDAVKSGRSVGVPGVIAMLALAHGEHGKLAWRELWSPAIAHAETGFRVSQRMHDVATQAKAGSPLNPDAARYLTTDRETILPVGHLLKNAAYAATLRRIAEYGPRGFYEGPVAAAMIAGARQEPMPGTLTLADLKAYRAEKHEPICRGYRIYFVCGMEPPSSGGIAILSILGTLEHFDLRAHGPKTVLGWHYLIEAQRLAYADRDLYVGDDRFVKVPIAGMLDTNYLRTRAALVSVDKAIPKVEAGVPPGAERRGRDATGGNTGTSHFVVVDQRGNVVSMTTTVESLFGSQRMAGGFFLNNQLTDFSFRPVDDRGEPVANAPAAGKKPRSSMSPTIVFENGGFRMAVGSPGGNSIIGYVSKAIVGMLDWGLTPDEAVELPNVVARTAVVAEERRFDPVIIDGLKKMGHSFRAGRGAEGSGLHAVMLMPDGTLAGGADSRREGVARAP